LAFSLSFKYNLLDKDEIFESFIQREKENSSRADVTASFMEKLEDGSLTSEEKSFLWDTGWEHPDRPEIYE